MKIVNKGTQKRQAKKVLGDVKIVERQEYEDMTIDSQVELIKELIPIGMMAVSEALAAEVIFLAGQRHQRKIEGQPSRYGSNPGTVRLAGQAHPIRVPRLRNETEEIRLESYQQLHSGTVLNESLFRKVLYGISCRNYEAAADAVPGALGLSKSTVSKEFIKVSAEKLKQFEKRDLSDLDIITLFIDGKTFAEDSIVLVVGVTIKGRKIPLGFIQTATENHVAICGFFNTLLDRGLNAEQGLLFVVDGAKGFQKAIKEVFRKRALIQRCQWHKRENVLSYLPKSRRSYWRRRLSKAYNQTTYQQAKQALNKIMDDLEDENQSAAGSLREGLEETLTLHKLGGYHLVGRSLKTTNCIESIFSMVETRTAKISYWKNSSQKHRWFASALIDSEPRLHTLMGVKHLYKLRQAIMKELKLVVDEPQKLAA